MWYAIFVATGRELEVYRLIAEHLEKAKYTGDYELLVLRRIVREKKQGKITEVSRVLFQGYVLIRSDDIETIYQKIKGCKYTYRFLKTEDKFCEIESKEIEHIRNIADAEGIIGISKALAIGDRIIITSGSLANYHGNIVKINKHESRVKIEVSLNGIVYIIDLAVEIVYKDDNEDNIGEKRES